MTSAILTSEQAADALRDLVDAASPATLCPANLAEQVLAARRRRRIRRSALVGGSAGLACAALVAATQLGHSPYFSVVQPSVGMEPTVMMRGTVVLDKHLDPVRGVRRAEADGRKGRRHQRDRILGSGDRRRRE